MTQLGEAVARYHKILENESLTPSGWLEQLRARMVEHNLVVAGRPVSPVLRPHFLSRRQYTSLVKTSEVLNSAIDRIRKMALSNPAIMARMELLPAEKMLASVDPGYSVAAVAAMLATQVDNGSMHVIGSQTDLPSGVIYSEALAEIFYDLAPVKEFRKKYKLSKTGGSKPFLAALLKAWKEFGGKRPPNVAILEFKQPFATVDTHESTLLAELLRKQGCQVEIVSPDQLDYRGDKLQANGFEIDLVYRALRAHDFLMRFDLTHPLVRAYRERRVCVVNSFRMEMTRKKSLLALLTDSEVTASFPAAERKAIAETVPLTRVVAQAKAAWGKKTVDLPEYILKHRETLTLRPNDESAELPTFDGATLDENQWQRALKTALRSPYVVQERVEPLAVKFPVDVYGEMAYRDLTVDVQPQSFLGKVYGVTARVSPAQTGYSTLAGFAPVYIMETK
jgi:hypothetical protein